MTTAEDVYYFLYELNLRLYHDCNLKNTIEDQDKK